MPGEEKNQEQKHEGTEGGEAAPKYMTAEEFNKALTAREKRFSTTIEKMFADFTAKIAPPKTEESEAEDEQPEKRGEGNAQGAGKPPAAGADDATAKQLRQLQKRLETAEREREAERKAREEQAAKLARDEERTKLTETLTAAGVDPKKVRAAVALLHTEDRKVRRNSEGKIAFFDGEDDEQDLGAGVKAWLATDEGKAFMPPRGAAGAGIERGNARDKANGKDPKAAGKAALLAAIRGTPG